MSHKWTAMRLIKPPNFQAFVGEKRICSRCGRREIAKYAEDGTVEPWRVLSEGDGTCRPTNHKERIDAL